jgi:hypothetical protein
VLRMRRGRALRVVMSICLAATAAGLVGASAASLNGAATAKLGGWTYPQSISAPTVLTWANFTGTTGTNLGGRALNGPGSWVADVGTWTIQTNQAGSSNAAISNLDVSVGSQNASVLATLTIGASANAGLVANDNGTVALYALYSKAAGGTITLYKYSGGATVLATATGVGTPTSGTLKVDSTTTTIKVSWNGTQIISYALTAAEATTFHSAGNNRFGLIADSDAVTRFDDFHVDQ